METTCAEFDFLWGFSVISGNLQGYYLKISHELCLHSVSNSPFNIILGIFSETDSIFTWTVMPSKKKKKKKKKEDEEEEDEEEEEKKKKIAFLH
jgi:hypothetical protein